LTRPEKVASALRVRASVAEPPMDAMVSVFVAGTMANAGGNSEVTLIVMGVLCTSGLGPVPAPVPVTVTVKVLIEVRAAVLMVI
jgi:hypothetical protein